MSTTILKTSVTQRAELYLFSKDKELLENTGMNKQAPIRTISSKHGWDPGVRLVVVILLKQSFDAI
jgi:hypothetical protein